jgi:Cd2+/Zn2+-exporting ATPase/Cu+-exporting ATPase
VAKIEKVVRNLKGIKEAKVNLTSKKATIVYNMQEIDLSRIKKTITGLGYRVDEYQKVQRGFKRKTGGYLINFFRLGFVGVVILLSLFRTFSSYLPFDIVILGVLIGGIPIFRDFFFSLRAKTITVDTPFSIAIAASLVIGEFLTAGVLVFWMLMGKIFDEFTTQRSRRAIEELVRLTPNTAIVKRDDNEVEVDISEIIPGDIVIIRPGERIAVDGEVIKGQGSVDQSPITGESMPIEKTIGDKVFAGTINQLGALQVKATKVGEDTTLAKIIRLVEEAEQSKSSIQRLADRFATYFTPTVLGAGVITYLITGKIMSALAVMVVACPCAVALAAPLAILASSGRAAKRGIIIKGGIYLETLAKIDMVVMDKTGTITFGEPKVTDVLPQDEVDKKRLLQLAASTDRLSEHPLASALLAEAKRQNISIVQPDSFQAVPGMGAIAKINGDEIVLGSLKLLKERSIFISDRVKKDAQDLEEQGKTVIFLAQTSKIKGIIGVADMIREVVPETINKLRNMGIKNFVMLTGDNQPTAKAIAKRLGIEYKAELLPQDKVKEIKKFQLVGKKVLMVGDGINDAPALAQADIGIAMGVAGTDVAIETADIALMQDDLSQIPAVIKIGRRTFRIIKQNLAEAVIFNLVGISLAAIGILHPIMAAAAHILPDIAIFLNSSRLFRDERRGESNVYGMSAERRV